MITNDFWYQRRGFDDARAGAAWAQERSSPSHPSLPGCSQTRCINLSAVLHSVILLVHNHLFSVACGLLFISLPALCWPLEKSRRCDDNKARGGWIGDNAMKVESPTYSLIVSHTSILAGRLSQPSPCPQVVVSLPSLFGAICTCNPYILNGIMRTRRQSLQMRPPRHSQRCEFGVVRLPSWGKLRRRVEELGMLVVK